jgi:hypothetical protein
VEFERQSSKQLLEGLAQDKAKSLVFAEERRNRKDFVGQRNILELVVVVAGSGFDYSRPYFMIVI